MSGTVFVTNRGSIQLTDGYDGVRYEFKKNVPVELPLHVATHIFGYRDSDKEPYLARLGWIRSKSELDKGLEKLAEFEISDSKPQDHSLPSVGGVVPLRVEKHAGGKTAQRAA